LQYLRSFILSIDIHQGNDQAAIIIIDDISIITAKINQLALTKIDANTTLPKVTQIFFVFHIKIQNIATINTNHRI
jgi:hypothetical protein